MPAPSFSQKKFVLYIAHAGGRPAAGVGSELGQARVGRAEFRHPDRDAFTTSGGIPFIDGIKRTGAAAAIIFLDMNDVKLEADEEGLGELTLRVVTGSTGEQAIAAFFRRLAHSPVLPPRGCVSCGRPRRAGRPQNAPRRRLGGKGPRHPERPIVTGTVGR